MLFLVSSKRSEADFIEQYVQTLKGVETSLVIDEPQWVVKPHMFGDERFKVAVGNKYIKSKIIESDEEAEAFIKQGYQVIDVPVELRRQFELDLEGSLMDLAGISTTLSSKFISFERLKQCYISTKNPFTANILEIGLDDDLQIKDFFKIDEVPMEIRSRPGFLHIDTSLNGDKTGIGYTIIAGAGLQSRLDVTEGVMKERMELNYLHVFSVGIKAPSSSEISLEKTRQFIYYLKNNGFNIKMITTDGFQSADTRQILTTNGFRAELLSLDRSPEGYITTRSAINEMRVGILQIKELETELINLERDNQSGKIDHPDNGSKDLADGFAGSLYSASRYKDEYLFVDAKEYNDIIEINSSANTDEIDRLTTVVLKDDTKVLSDINADRVNKEIEEVVSKSLSKMTPLKSTSIPNPFEESQMFSEFDNNILSW
jgi:hypothetical protein